jgi:hypothetical protein
MSAFCDPVVNEKQASEIVGVTPGTLQVWRCTRRYPLPYIKVGRAVRYRVSDLQAFLASRTVGGASSQGATPGQTIQIDPEVCNSNPPLSPEESAQLRLMSGRSGGVPS